MRKPVLLTVSMATAVLVACGAAVLTAVPVVGQTASVTLVGAGDIAGCSEERHSGATANLLGKISGSVYTLGDNVQGQGDINEFRNCYDPTWGKYKRRTRPAVGNHEYQTPGASPYYDYFGARAGAARIRGPGVVLYWSARRPTGGGPVEDRINYFERMLADNPDNPTGLLALANEYKKAGREEDEAAVLKRYVQAHEDEGNAYLRLGEVLTKLGREDEAREAYGTGVGQAEKFGHSGMAEDLRLAQVRLGG